MKICYLYNPTGKHDSDDTEGHICAALQEMGHAVAMIPEEKVHEAIKVGNQADMFFFHKGGPRILDILPHVQTPKVFWYFDKVWNERVAWMDSVLPHVSMGFLTDGDEVERRKDPKLRVLHQGIAHSMTEMRPRNAKKREIVFFGSIYGERGAWINKLRARYGKAFEIVDNAHGRDLVDAVAAARVVVAPAFPSTDKYWSNRLYLILGCGGVLVHPKLAGMQGEYEDGVHYLGYRSDADMYASIEWAVANWDSPEVAKIRFAAQVTTRARHTLEKRIERLIHEFTEYAGSPDLKP